MAHVLDTSRFALPSDAVISAFGTDFNTVSRSQLLRQVRKNLEKGRAAQEEWASAFDGLFQEAMTSDFSAPSLMRWSAALLERQSAALERLYPFLDPIPEAVRSVTRLGGRAPIRSSKGAARQASRG
jgi:hypothetical protein